ncbi:hypothetical protein ATANTOWER_000352 [Ataeniobius toweri]|uniref:Uncharacterized protein n=1 Tax=Ataeniobius toweri TaxID=208326 RepID=A0ABU7AAA4_9TELE|nr:hypothetical protein [Ataeniobius toweri]
MTVIFPLRQLVKQNLSPTLRTCTHRHRSSSTCRELRPAAVPHCHGSPSVGVTTKCASCRHAAMFLAAGPAGFTMGEVRSPPPHPQGDIGMAPDSLFVEWTCLRSEEEFVLRTTRSGHGELVLISSSLQARSRVDPGQVASVISSAIICWGSSIRARDLKKTQQADKEGWLCSGDSSGTSGDHGANNLPTAISDSSLKKPA